MPIPDTLARKITADFRAEKKVWGPKKNLWRSAAISSQNVDRMTLPVLCLPSEVNFQQAA